MFVILSIIPETTVSADRSSPRNKAALAFIWPDDTQQWAAAWPTAASGGLLHTFSVVKMSAAVNQLKVDKCYHVGQYGKIPYPLRNHIIPNKATFGVGVPRGHIAQFPAPHFSTDFDAGHGIKKFFLFLQCLRCDKVRYNCVQYIKHHPLRPNLCSEHQFQHSWRIWECFLFLAWSTLPASSKINNILD